MIWVYVGGCDVHHDLRPCLRAFAGAGTAVRLLVVGDGPDRAAWEEAAGPSLGRTVTFVGAVPHDRVPIYIGAADLCLGPYPVERWPGGSIGFATLKLPEYMACARPVASVPSGSILDLVEDGRTGLLFDDTAERWSALLADPPGRPHLAEMGRRAAGAVADRTWSATAEGLLAAARAAVRRSPVAGR